MADDGRGPTRRHKRLPFLWLRFWVSLSMSVVRSKVVTPSLTLLNPGKRSNGNADRSIQVIYDIRKPPSTPEWPDIQVSDKTMAVTTSAIFSVEQVANSQGPRDRPITARDLATDDCLSQAEGQVVEGSTLSWHDRRCQRKAAVLPERLARCLGLPGDSCYGVYVFCKV